MAQTTALDRARQRALDSTQPKESGLRNPSSVTKKPSGEMIQRPDGSKVPIEYFDLPDEQKARFDQLLKEGEAEAQNESLALQYTLTLGDQQASDARRITALESQLNAAMSAMEALQRRMGAIDTSVEAGKSDALVEQESQAAQTVVNMASTTSDGNALIQRIERAKEDFNREADARLAAIEQPLAELVGRVQSAGTIYQEGIIANQNQLADVSARMESMKVQVTELEGRSDALGTPITRDEMREMVTSTVASEFPLQLPAMVSKELAVQKATGELGEGMAFRNGFARLNV